MTKQHTVAVGLMLLLSSLLLGEANELDLTPERLIERAHQYDNMWASNQDADQKKALECYGAALQAGPDDRQRLHILYRMAQLHGSAYQLEKGERPNFHKAIELNERIVQSYPPSEPLVSKALISLGDHHVTLRQFGKGLEYFRKVLEYDVSELERARRAAGSEQERRLLAANIERIKRFQKIGVDQIEYCADLIHPLSVHKALQEIAATHSQAFIREYAAGKLTLRTDPFLDLWAPPVPTGTEARSVEARQPVADAQRAGTSGERDGGASPPTSLTVEARASPHRPTLVLYVLAGLSAFSVLVLARIVITRRRSCTFTGKDA